MTDASLNQPSGQSKIDQLTASPRIFENPILDKLSRIHWTFPLVYLPFAAWMIWAAIPRMSVPALLGMIVLGYVIWTFCEYLFHRYLFHWEPPGKIGERIHFLLHGVHHVHPSDPLRLVMPPLMSVPMIVIAWFVATLLFGVDFRLPAMAGFIIGYVIYDEIHFHIHHRPPRTKIEATLRRLHMLHHFRDPDRGYGVSAPWWDTIFGTAYTKSDKPGSKAL